MPLFILLRRWGFSRASGMLALTASTVAASAQVLPPTSTDSDQHVVTPAISIAPPVSAMSAMSDTPMPPPNESFTTSALLGYVSDHPIFVGDIFRRIDAQLRQAAKAAADVDEFKSKAGVLINNELSRRVSNIIIVSAAQSTLTSEDKDRIDLILNKGMADLKTEHGGSDAAAAKYLESLGSSIDEFKSDQRDDVIKGIYFARNLQPRIVVTADMCKDYYNRDPSKWKVAAWVDLYTITLPVSRWLPHEQHNGETGELIANPTAQQIKDAEAQAMATAKEIVAKAKAGSPFDRLVEDYDSRDIYRDKGGRYTNGVTKGSLVNPKLENYVFSLPANAIGAPLLLHDPDVNNSTVMVIKIGQKIDAHTIMFREASTQIEETLRQEKLHDLEDKEMSRLSQGAPIERVDEMLSVAVNAAVTRYMMK